MQGLVDRASVGGWAVGMEKRRRKRSSLVRYAAAVPTGFKLRLRASSLAVGMGNPVPTWADESGFGNHATQGVAAQQPTLTTTAWGRLSIPVVSFDSVDDGMTTGLNIASGACSIFIVMVYNAPGMPCAFLCSASNSLWGFSYAYGNGYFGAGTAAVQTNYLPYALCLIDMRVAVGQFAAQMFVNGALAAQAPTVSAPGVLAFGSSGASMSPGGCLIAELIVYNRLLTDSETVQLRRYFQSTYNFLNL